MPEAKDKTKKWRTKFAATKRVIAADAPPGRDAKTALVYGIIGIGIVVPALLLTYVIRVHWLPALAVWALSMPFAIMGVLRGKFEGDVIRAGRSPVRGKPLAATGMFLGIASVAAAVVALIITGASHSAGPSVLPGKFGSPEKTYEEYVRALRQDDFEAYVACHTARMRFDRDGDGDGVDDGMSEERRKLLEKSFEKSKKGRVRQELNILSKPEYSAGGKTALDAGRAELQVRCFNKRINQTSDARMSFKREEEGWKITNTDL